MDDIVIIIPAYKPDGEILLEFIENVKKHFENIVVVNDGSGEAYNDIFDKIQKQEISVIKHYINLGKGRAIKTAFNYILNKYPNMTGVVTADCDGQHHIEDIIKCAKKLKEAPNKLVIGTRNFNEKQVPFKSRFGNKMTRAIFGTFVGIKITDTQSGLRAFGKQTMMKFLQTSGERYEYETNMLIECKEKEIEIEEIPISTVYIRNNSLSHFDVLRDSFRIYKLFIKYIISALSSFFIDVLLFAIILKMLPTITWGIVNEIVIASIIARIISSIYNFGINAKVVFKSTNKKSITKYFALVIIQMLVSAFSVSTIFKITRIDTTAIKVVVDTIIFIINFVIQREWVFKKQ